MFAVTGANGNLGREALGFLLEKTEVSEIAALVRNPETLKDLRSNRILVRKADYDDPRSLAKALEGVERVLQISTGGVDNPFARQQEANVVKAVSESKAARIIYTSAVQAKENAVFHVIATQFQTEELIRKTGVPHVIFRNSKYMESIPYLIGPALQTGEIRYPAGDAKISYVSRKDIAEALANALAASVVGENIYEVTGERSYSFRDLAELIASIKNVPVKYIDCTDGQFKDQLLRDKIPLQVADSLVNMAVAIRAGEFSHVDVSLEALLGRKPGKLSEYIAAI